MPHVHYWIITIWLGILLLSRDSSQNHFECQLRAKLFTNYNRDVHPQLINTPVNVSLNIAFASLKNMDVKKEEISINIWQRQYWYDERLAWNSSENGNITQLRVLLTDIWTPDIYLYYSSGEVKKFGKNIPGSLQFGATLNDRGGLFFSQPTIIYAPCEIDVEFYPFDDQFCELTFGTWSQDISVVRMVMYKGGVDTSSYLVHNEWEIVSVKPERQMVQLKSSDGYTTVVYKIHLRRHALFYMVNYIMPSVIIAVLSLLVFLIPPEVGKRMEAGINLLLCLSVYLMLVNSKMPLSSKSFPLLTKFYGCTIIILVVSLCCCCWVYSYYFMNPSGWDVYQLPVLLQVVIFDYLGSALTWPCKLRVSLEKASTSKQIVIDCHDSQEVDEGHTNNVKQNEISNKNASSARENELHSEAGFYNNKQIEMDSRYLHLSGGEEGAVKDKDYLYEPLKSNNNYQDDADDKNNDDDENLDKQRVTGTSVSELTMDAVPPDSLNKPQDIHLIYLAKSSQENQQKLNNTEKWKTAAIILDRFFIILLVISIVASLLACFLSSPRVRRGLV